MGGRVGIVGRVRWIAVFTALLLASSAVPVFAADAAEEQLSVQEAPIATSVTPPGGKQVQEAVEAAEHREATREEELQSEELVRQREESRYAFTGLSAIDAQQLLLKVFAPQIAALNADPARYLSEVELIRAYDGRSATVRDEGDGSLLEAGIPVRTENEDGELAKVDLSLETSGIGYEPTNPLTDLYVPDSAGEAIEIGNDGLALEPVGADEGSQAQLVGAKNVLFHEARTDTDLMVSPIASGVEIFDQLRSVESPETFRYRLDLPEGAQLRRNGAGGADIVKEGEARNDGVFAVVSPPSAVDAQGTPVPTELEVEGSTIMVQVPHREGDFAYPILLDPAVWEEAENAWFFGYALEALEPSIWAYNTNDWSESYIMQRRSCLTTALCSPSNRGLFISTLNRNIPANTWGHFSYSVPGSTTYIPSIYPPYSVYLNPFWRNNEGCSWNSYKQPHDYNGSYDANGNWLWFETDRAQWYGNAAMVTNAKGIAFGMSTGGSSVNIPCWRDIMLGGAVIHLDDPEAPTLSSVSGIPSGWVSDTTQFTISATSSDPGLGVQNVTMAPQGNVIRYFTPLQNQCPGTKPHPCPAAPTSQMTVNGLLFDEGQKNVDFSVYDPTGETSNTISRTIRVDRTPPEVTLDGQLAIATDENEGDAKDPEKWDTLSLPVYNLKIEAKDGAVTADPATKRSGVKSIEIFLDGKTTAEQSWQQACEVTNGSCPMTQTYPLGVGGLAAGKHTLEVKVKDQVGKERKRNIEFEYFPATGMKDEYVMHYFPLDDGEGNEAEEEHPRRPELAVNVMNGNLVYREQDIDVEGSGIDLEVERYYNSLLPDSENTEWGDGWTLAQTPELEPEDTGGTPAADEAELIDSSGAIEDDVTLPTDPEEKEFAAPLRATLTKTGDGYEMVDETGEEATTIAFDESGRAEAVQATEQTQVEFEYEAGDLDEIAVEDPGSAGGDPELVEYPGPPAYGPRYSGIVGTLGTGDGQLTAPADVALDAGGNLWVVDRANNRIQKFNAKGEYVSKFGTYGSGTGQFNRPTSIAVDPQGNLWVTDAGNSRVQKFSSSGTFLLKFGSKGTGNGQFSGAGPEYLATDASGNVWVSDTYNGRLQKFSPSGAFLEVLGTKGSEPGQLGIPAAIDVAPDGDIWVVDWYNNRVSVFSSGDPEGGGSAVHFVRQFGTAGTEEGQFDRPNAIEVDKDGNVWVGDQNNGRVQRFNLDGEYRGEFGSKGSGEGQFSFTYPMGIVADKAGTLWITDVNNNRVQRWAIPAEVPKYSSSFGTYGAGDGQLEYPADVAIDAEGSFLVVDKSNERIQKFNSKGEYVSQFGGYGTGPGKFEEPTSITVDQQGYIWVTDSAACKVSKFTSEGVFVARYGSAGSGGSQFSSPGGIAVDGQGNILIADKLNGRLQRLSSSGTFLGAVGSKGSSPGQLGEPAGIDVGPEGNIWVADFQHQRVSVFAPGEGGGYVFLQQFGSLGNGPGQFNRPSAIDVDAEGNVWVGDQNNNRVQLFNQAGEFITQFGSKGSEPGQFKLMAPMGIATDDQGGIWVTDHNNHRVQEWLISSRVRIEDDPSVEVDVEGGLVEAVEGEDAGTHSYDHVGDDLISHDGPQGETQYSYNANGRLTDVMLPNGTSAHMEYKAGYGRVTSVTVDPAGSDPAKTTYFGYGESPRRTIVVPPDAPHVVYDIGEDGSVLKWWNSEQPPELDDISGSLYFDREKGPIPIGDHNFVTQAHSEEGIASIQVIADGNVLVDEIECDKPQVIECKTLLNEWVTETGAHAPGILHLEVVATDRLGHSTSKRFWVDIPYTPPPAPGALVPPKFKDIKQFREEYGLEVLFPVATELELNDRIFDLIGAWHNPHTPAGEVARASWERWGVPLRSADVAELEYREQYLHQAAAAIPGWADTHASGQYAGYYVDHRQGGVIHIGFTANQSSRVTELANSDGLIAPSSRLAGFDGQPQTSVSSLSSLSNSLPDQIQGSPIGSLVAKSGIDIRNNTVVVGATNPTTVETYLTHIYGATAPIEVVLSSQPSQRLRDRPLDHYLRAGDWISAEENGETYRCSLGFGAAEKRQTKPNKQWTFLEFALTAGHCGSIGTRFSRVGRTQSGYKKLFFGEVRRQTYEKNIGGFYTDGAAILLEGFEPPKFIYLEANTRTQRVAGAETVAAGETLCTSGTTTGIDCGTAHEPFVSYFYGRPEWVVQTDAFTDHGDSGGAVWNPTTGKAVGLIVSGPEPTPSETWFSPLRSVARPTGPPIPGLLDLLDAPGGGPFNMVRAN